MASAMASKAASASAPGKPAAMKTTAAKAVSGIATPHCDGSISRRRSPCPTGASACPAAVSEASPSVETVVIVKAIVVMVAVVPVETMSVTPVRIITSPGVAVIEPPIVVRVPGVPGVAVISAVVRIIVSVIYVIGIRVRRSGIIIPIPLGYARLGIGGHGRLRCRGLGQLRPHLRSALNHRGNQLVRNPAPFQFNDVRSGRVESNRRALDVGFYNIRVYFGVQHLKDIPNARRKRWALGRQRYGWAGGPGVALCVSTAKCSTTKYNKSGQGEFHGRSKTRRFHRSGSAIAARSTIAPCCSLSSPLTTNAKRLQSTLLITKSRLPGLVREYLPDYIPMIWYPQST